MIQSPGLDTIQVNFLSSATDFIKSSRVVADMNNPESKLYIADPDPNMNCTQLIDAKKAIDGRRAEIRMLSGAFTSLTVAAAVNREIDRKLTLYDTAIQTCTPAPLPEIYNPVATNTVPEIKSPVSVVPNPAPTISTETKPVFGPLSNLALKPNINPAPVPAVADPVNPASTPAQTEVPPKTNNKKIAIIIGAGVILLTVVAIIIIKKT